MTPLFLFGTLRDEELFQIVAGEAPAPVEASLKDHEVVWAEGADYPLCRPAAGQSAAGLLIADLSEAARVRIAAYEARFGYSVRSVIVRAGGAEIAAEAFFPDDPVPASEAAFDLDLWQTRHAPLARAAAEELLADLTRRPDLEASPWVSMRARAQSRLAAVSRPAPELPGAPRDGDAALLGVEVPYNRFFRVEERRLRPARFDGQAAPEVLRAVFVMVDAVTVLPYDPARDRVLLVEQFRAGPQVRGDPQPWFLEAVAGRVDGGESWEETAHRELAEEAGLQATRLEKIAEFYPSPGAVSEYIISYLALCDLPDGAAGLHGLAEEHEDIRTRLMSVADLEAALEGGLIRNGPLLSSAYWLLRQRDRLRAEHGAGQGGA